MADFQTAYNLLKIQEGGLSNDPNDRGGKTFMGISKVFDPEWVGWGRIDFLNSTHVLLTTDKALLSDVQNWYADKWISISLSQITNQSFANEIFDCAINEGSGTAILFLQRSLNVTNNQGKYFADLKKDGKIGPKTISAVNNHPNLQACFTAYNALRGNAYISICEANPSQEVFMIGWMNRINNYKFLSK